MNVSSTSGPVHSSEGQGGKSGDNDSMLIKHPKRLADAKPADSTEPVHKKSRHSSASTVEQLQEASATSSTIPQPSSTRASPVNHWSWFMPDDDPTWFAIKNFARGLTIAELKLYFMSMENVKSLKVWSRMAPTEKEREYFASELMAERRRFSELCHKAT
ncbi:MAG: hypothetical protein Q9211_001944 [Gyalolechia sp. 1 TL-2023]